MTESNKEVVESPQGLKSLHLVDGDGILVKSENIIEFLNSEVAGVQSTPSLGGSPISLNLKSVKSENPTSFCHQYIRQVIGLKYHVVGVFGGQSSGKSTLLNAVFGTNFQTMNAEEGRHQTTKGAFMSITTAKSGHLDNVPSPVEDSEGNIPVPRPFRPVPPLEDPLLIVDFEGTDGVERGEDQSLERHLSLFALSIADTLIINMWTTEVGRFNGANLSLLRTVFEVNLQLFAHDHNLDKERPTLLFVMRDSTNPGHFNKNCERVRASIDKIWETINKPVGSVKNEDGVPSDSIERFFNVKFFAFPHYELQRSEFIDQIGVFRKLFISEADQAGPAFSSPNSFRGIPLEAVPQYLSSCWDSILKSKDLDIPSQREMLSRFRCKDLVDEKVNSYKQFTSHICERMSDRGDINFGSKVRDGRISGKDTLQGVLQAEFDRLVNEYNEESRLYSLRIVSDNRDKLRSELLVLYNNTVKVQCNVVIKEVMRNLEGDVHELVDGIIRTHIWQNQNILKTAELPIGDILESGIDSDLKQSDVTAIVREFWKALCDGTRSMAKSVSSAEESVQQQLLGRCYAAVQSDPALREMVSGQLNIAVATLIKKRLESMASDAAGAMHKTFEYVLNHQPDGSLKIFTTAEGLQKQFRPARFAGLVLAACLFYSRMEVREHSSSVEALLHGDGDTLLESEGEDDAEGFTKDVGSKALFARTLSSMSSVTVRFKENDAEKNFYLDLGGAHIRIDKIASFVNSKSTQGSHLQAAPVLSGSDRKGTSVGFNVFYPPFPAGSATPRFNKRDGEESDDGSQPDGAEDDLIDEQTHAELSNSELISHQNVLISRSSLRRALQLFHQQIYFTFQIQLASVEAKSRGSQIPIGMWVALIYFAHDEIFYVLRSPVLLICVILAAYFFFSSLIQKKWEEFEETGPPVVVAFVRQAIAMSKPYLEGIKEQLKPLNEIGKTDPAAAPKADSEVKAQPPSATPPVSTPRVLSTTAELDAGGVRQRKPTVTVQ